MARPTRVVRERPVLMDDRYDEPIMRERSLRVVDEVYEEPVRTGYREAGGGHSEPAYGHEGGGGGGGGGRRSSGRFVEEYDDDYVEPAAAVAPVRYASARGGAGPVEYEEGGGYGPERRGPPVSGAYYDRPSAAAYGKEDEAAPAPRVARAARAPAERSSGYEGGRYEPD